MEENASAIHSMYILSLSSFGFMVAVIIIHNPMWFWFLIIFVFAFVSAFFWDKSYEDIELGIFDSLNEEDKCQVNDVANRLIISMGIKEKDTASGKSTQVSVNPKINEK